ncbi:FAD binding domain-containing protein [Jiella sonneratiae]|uniref:FAD binding domain-containing protein n=1 Tax=Jiella sonneratiae TaxID=2816856 RepID=A0ABS3J0Y3_9HYPH|nr:FAD binding domain-containing protein [Jiella sonneratiae]MBO0903345.1 FAD binding domain-containing protein [Jiella sonneratiae]
MQGLAPPPVAVPRTLPEALAALSAAGDGAAPLAGGTWIMRAPIRHEAHAPAYVALGRIAELRRIDVADDEVAIGAAVTHAELAKALSPFSDLAALAAAAAGSANPAVRNAATIGGNLCARGFPAADLVPALLCLDAVVEIAEAAAPAGSRRLPVEAFLADPAATGGGRIVTRIVLKRSGLRSVHVRLPLRKAGDYPVAIVSAAIGVGGGGRVESARIAVGSVEAAPRRWTGLEGAINGERLDPARIAALAASLAPEFSGRDGVEAPGWYRVRVLPTLVGRAIAALAAAA